MLAVVVGAVVALFAGGQAPPFAPSAAPAAAPSAAQTRAPWGTGESKGSDLEVDLVTFGTGDDITEWFGHSALVVDDKRLHQSRLYNYGEFAFDRTVIFKYALGHLTFHVGERSVAPTLAQYQQLNRSVHMQELALTDDEKLAIALALSDNALPEHRDYQYDHYLDNCATRPRDMIDLAVKGRLRALTKPGRMTLREHTRRHTSVNPPMSILIDSLENKSVDRPITTWDEAFLPQELADQVKAAGLVKSERDVYVAKRAPLPSAPPTYAPLLFLLGLGYAALTLTAVFTGRRRMRAALSLFASLALGVLGLVLALMWIITEHIVAWHNENLFWLNPILVVAGPLSLAALVMKPARAVAPERALSLLWALSAALGVVGVIAKVLPVMGQNTWQVTLLALPVLLSQAFAFLAPPDTRRSGQ